MNSKIIGLTLDEKKTRKMMALNLAMGVFGVYLYRMIYRMLPGLPAWLTYTLLPLEAGYLFNMSV